MVLAIGDRPRRSADMVVQVEAARLLIARAAVNAGTSAPAPLEASVAKHFANQMGKQVSDLAIQLHGGYGYSEEYEVERLHRDAHGWALAGGTPAMRRIRIARSNPKSSSGTRRAPGGSASPE